MEYPEYKYILYKKGSTELFLNKNYNEFFNYLNNTYKDVNNIREKLYLFYFKMQEPPKCIVCGKRCLFFGLNKGYSEYCSPTCANKSPKRIEKIKKTCLEKYGFENASKSNIIKEKTKKTCFDRYGVEFVGQIAEQKEKACKTKLERYNNSTYNNYEKGVKTKIEKYGENYCKLNTINSKQTKFLRYGNETFVNPEKTKQTCISKYGYENFVQTDEFKQIAKQTCLRKYGVDSFSKTKQFKDNLHNNKDIILEKIYITKNKNHSFNTSKIEKCFEQYLIDNNINYKSQYKSNMYPFKCDFYFPDKDLYFEINSHWTHGGHPFDDNNCEDIKTLNIWKSKNTKFFNNAITTWTIRDAKKRETAKQNNLNYIECFTNSLNELIEIINNV